MMLRTSIALIAAALLAWPSAQPSGDVTGQVVLPPAPKKGPKPGRYPGSKPAAPYVRGPAIVFLEPADGAGRGTHKPPETPVVLEQKDRQFAPLALAVLAGTTVEFPNRDDEHHNVFSRSAAKELELGRYGKDESRKVVFDRPGLVKLRCEIHANMHAVIAILEFPWFATTDAEGRFTLTGVPAGRYKAHVYQEDLDASNRAEDPLRAVVQEIEVPEGGLQGVDFDLTK